MGQTTSSNQISTRDSESTQETTEPKWYLPALLFLAGISIVALLLTPRIAACFAPDNGSPGEFGDQYGFANALISAIAFAGLIVTINLQRRDLVYQRQESALARADTSRQLETLKLEIEGNLSKANQSSMEQVFFRMMELREELLQNVREGHGENAYYGRDAIKRIGSFAATDVKQYMKSRSTTDIKSRRKQYSNAYIKWYNDTERHNQIGHFLRLTYHCIRVVHDWRDIDDQERYGYIRILRAQLSNAELQLLFLNCVSSKGWPKFMPLANRYNLFENLHPDHDVPWVDKRDRNFTKSSVGGQMYKPDRPDDDLYALSAEELGQHVIPPGKGLGTSSKFHADAS